jgi:two-component system phosphate regulon sensor histidine kinase PhoR
VSGRLGFRASIFLGAAAAAALTLLIASTVHSSVLALIAGLGAAIAASVFIAAELDSRLSEIDTVHAHAAQQLSQEIADLTADRARTDALLSGMVEGVLAIDGAGRLQLINDAARRMFHLENIPLGRPYVEAVRHPVIAELLSGALRAGQPEPAEVPIGARVFSAQATTINGPSWAADAEGGGAVLVLHDITDLRRADRVRRDFVANVSHELRTPLTAVRGYVEALMDGPSTPEQRKKFLEVIDRHTGRMERLVRDLLRLARLDAQQEAAERQPCDVASQFKAVTADLVTLIEQKQVLVDVAVNSDACVALFDPTKLHDALRNLIENAVKYSPPGGRVTLAARAEGDHVALTISDEGPGLPDSDLERVFERFYRVDKSRTADPGGTGLGLSIARHLVELQGGRVTARNNSTAGATFTILLPK